MQRDNLTALRERRVGRPPLIMGVVNVTPDSFSDGGAFLDPARAVDHALGLVEAGAEILDIGGESTRPGADPVSLDAERARVIPVIERLAGATDAILSIDTRKAGVMKAALGAGAGMINDVSALRHDPDALAVAAAFGAPIVLMHAKGEPKTMQADPRYDDVLAEVEAFFRARIAACAAAGIGPDRLILDPGIGFGKRLHHNLELIRGLGRFRAFGLPLLLGASRKSFIGAIEAAAGGDVAPADRRLGGSLAAALAGAAAGADILRVHDVAELRQALLVQAALGDI